MQKESWWYFFYPNLFVAINIAKMWYHLEYRKIIPARRKYIFLYSVLYGWIFLQVQLKTVCKCNMRIVNVMLSCGWTLLCIWTQYYMLILFCMWRLFRCVILADLICAVIAIIHSLLTMPTLHMINNTATNLHDM